MLRHVLPCNWGRVMWGFGGGGGGRPVMSSVVSSGCASPQGGSQRGGGECVCMREGGVHRMGRVGLH